MKASITSIGTAVPANKLSQLDIAELVTTRLNLKAAQKRILKSVYRATGIDSRHSVLDTKSYLSLFSDDPAVPFPSTSARMKIYKDHASNLAINAINHCFDQLAETSLLDVTHLITVSCTGMYAPGIDIDIIQQLKLNTRIKRTAINFMGCYGAFNGLKVAEAICNADPRANVLVVCVELCSIHFQYSDNLDHLISNAIFSDGAAAALVQTPTTQKKYLKMEAFHCDLLPQTSGDMAWQIGDSGFDIILKSYIPEVIKSGISTFTNNLLSHYGSSMPDIDLYAIHPGGIKILQACESSLNLTKDQNKYAYNVLREYGNMSSATILFVLKAMWNDMAQEDHQKMIFSCAFGPGLTLESMLLKAHCHPL